MKIEKVLIVRSDSRSQKVEQFSIECRKTKTKLTIVANHNGRWQSHEPIGTRNNNLAFANRGKVTIGFDFTSDWLIKWREIF